MAHQQPQRRPALEPDQLSALWQACDLNDTAPLAHLIETLDPPDNLLKTCLATAVDHNRLNIVRYLLERGVSIPGHAVHSALRVGSIPALEMFREFGWDVNTSLGLNYNLTALNFATDNPTLVSYLLKIGANPNLGPRIGPGVGSISMLYLVPNSGRILQAAAEYGPLESVDLLIAHGALLSNASALHAAVEGGKVDIMARLLELGADVDEPDGLLTMGLEVYFTPLLRAIEQGKTNAVRLLLEKGASTMRKGRHEETALEMVKRDWVDAEIRKMVEQVGERGRGDEEVPRGEGEEPRGEGEKQRGEGEEPKGEGEL